jgi:hypothetical protein
MVEEWNSRLSEASPDELLRMIPEGAYTSFKEESLAREFVKRKIDTKEFLKTAKWLATKRILQGRLK